MPLFCYLGLADYPLGLFFILDLFLRVPVSYPLGQFFIVDLSWTPPVCPGKRKPLFTPSGNPNQARRNILFRRALPATSLSRLRFAYLPGSPIRLMGRLGRYSAFPGNPVGLLVILDLSLRAAVFVVSISRVGGGNQRGRHGPSGLPLYALTNVSHCSPRQAIRIRLGATSCVSLVTV